MENTLRGKPIFLSLQSMVIPMPKAGSVAVYVLCILQWAKKKWILLDILFHVALIEPLK